MDMGVRIGILKRAFINFSNGNQTNANILRIEILNLLCCIPFSR